jgi:cytochrome c553
MKQRRAAIAAAVTLTLLAAPACAEQARDLAAACANCHGTDGRSLGVVPSLAGQSKANLLQSLREFRDGKKPATIMHQISKGYSDAQFELLSDYFSRQPTTR